MSKSHLKRISLPRTWNVARKSFQKKKLNFISRPNPGKKLELAVSINTFVKELVKLAKTTKEVKSIIKFKHVYVNDTIIVDEKYPVGLFDAVFFEELDKSYRLSLNSIGKLCAIEIENKERKLSLKRVENKTLIKGGKIQLNLFGSSNLLIAKNDVSVGDVLVLKDKKAEKVLPLKKGNLAILIGGKHVGKVAKISSIEENNVVIEVDGTEFKTLKKYAYIIGDKSAEVRVQQ